MSTTSFVAVTAIITVMEIFPVATHRLITDPYPTNEWNSVLVSSNPIRIFERKQHGNGTTRAQKLRQVSRARKRSFEECPENDFKCLYGGDGGGGDEEDDRGETSDKLFDRDRYPGAPNLKLEEDEPELEQPAGEKPQNPGKSYWNSMPPRDHPRPYNDKNGWVTLDPVPWSTSKISKWHPNVEIHEPNSPWPFSSTSTQRPVHQFWVSGSSYRPQKPNIQLGIGSNDIITDNKPSGFPTGNVHSYHSSGFPLSVHHSIHEYKDPFQKYQQNPGPGDIFPPRYPGRPHPSTYPSQGNGEWVLLSTKKGYSQPNKWSSKTDLTKTNERIFWSRKIKPTEISRYHEEELSGTESTSGGKNDTASDRLLVPIQVEHPKGGDVSDAGSKRKVRLQVLPSPESTLSYGGMIEMDSNPQTVNEAMQEAKIKKLQTIANVKRNKIRGFKLIPATRVAGKGTNQRSAITLAAVGAGMIPATMAVLVPMAIGRSKRSVSTLRKQNDYYWRDPSREFPF